MKAIVLLLSVIVLVLSIVPCSACDNDDAVCKKECKKTSKHCNDDCKACSPFYTCGTCTGFVFSYPITIKLLTKVADTNRREIVYQDIFISSFTNAIWQPPKIA